MQQVCSAIANGMMNRLACSYSMDSGPIGRLLVIAALLAVPLFQGCATTDAGLPPAASVIAVSAGAGGLRFALAPGTCREARCAAVIQLLAGDKMLDFAELAFAASGSDLRPAAGDSGLDSGNRLAAWTAGRDDGTVTTAIETVELAAGRRGLLVRQVGGVDHLKRHYELFVADAGRLRSVWSVRESSGPVRSLAYVVASENGGNQDILYLEDFAPGGDRPDSLEARRASWDDASRTMQVRAVMTLPAVIIGDYPSPLAARTAASGTCAAGYWVVAGGRVGAAASRFALAMVVADPQSLAAEMARPCDIKASRRVGQFRFTVANR